MRELKIDQDGYRAAFAFMNSVYKDLKDRICPDDNASLHFFLRPLANARQSQLDDMGGVEITSASDKSVSLQPASAYTISLQRTEDPKDPIVKAVLNLSSNIEAERGIPCGTLQITPVLGRGTGWGNMATILIGKPLLKRSFTKGLVWRSFNPDKLSEAVAEDVSDQMTVYTKGYRPQTFRYVKKESFWGAKGAFVPVG